MSANVTVLKGKLGLDREYREVEREAKKGERIKVIAVSPRSKKVGNVFIGEIFTVKNVDEGGDVWAVRERSFEGIISPNWTGFGREYVVLEPTDVVRINGERFRLVERRADDGWLDHGNYHVLELLGSASNTPLPDVSEQQAQINGLTETVANLARRLAELERGQALKETPEPTVNKALTRDEIVEKAKGEVSDLRKFAGTDLPMHTVKFVVDRKKRTVVALIKGGVNARNVGYLSKGVAKCAPNECFNVYIGMAIALRRALGLDIPVEYVDAPQPEEPQVGDVVEKGKGFRAGSKGIVEQVGGNFNPRNPTWVYVDGHLGLTFFDENGEHVWAEKRHVRILDDSRDGRYGEVYSA